MNCCVCSTPILLDRYHESLLKIDGTILFYCRAACSRTGGRRDRDKRTPNTYIGYIDYNKDKRNKKEVRWSL